METVRSVVWRRRLKIVRFIYVQEEGRVDELHLAFSGRGVCVAWGKAL